MGNSIDREKVIEILEKAKTIIEGWVPMFEQYNTPAGIDGAIALLKAQEPVKPYMDYDGQDVWRCGSCGATLFHISHTQADENEQNCVRYCRYCGKAVKWD